MTPAAGSAEPSAYAARVLAVVAQIPSGKVMSYGDIAEFLGQGIGRNVGTVLRAWGDEVPWHRVVMSDGKPKPHDREGQLTRLRAEGTALVADRSRVDMRAARWDGR